MERRRRRVIVAPEGESDARTNGRHDTTTPPELAAAWLNRLAAPSKAIVWFTNSAHLPMLEEPGRMLHALITRARPLAGKDVAPEP